MDTILTWVKVVVFGKFEGRDKAVLFPLVKLCDCTRTCATLIVVCKIKKHVTLNILNMSGRINSHLKELRKPLFRKTSLRVTSLLRSPSTFDLFLYANHPNVAIYIQETHTTLTMALFYFSSNYLILVTSS